VFASIAVLILLILTPLETSTRSPVSCIEGALWRRNGLREGSEVRLAGVRVGKVDKITFAAPSDVPNAPRVEAL